MKIARYIICLLALAAGVNKTYSISIGAVNFNTSPPPVTAPSLDSEYGVIRRAAERNGIKYGSDDWYLLLAIRLAENGRVKYLQEKELTRCNNLVQLEKTKGFIWKKYVPNVINLNQKMSSTKITELAKSVTAYKTDSSMQNKTKVFYLPIDESIMWKIESLFLQINEKNISNIEPLIWNVLVSKDLNEVQKLPNVIKSDTKNNSNTYIYFSNYNEEGDVKSVDTTKITPPYTGIIKTLQKKSLIASLNVCQLDSSIELKKRLLNADYCVLIATTNYIIQNTIQQVSKNQSRLLLNVFENYVNLTDFCEVPSLEFGIMNPKANNLDLQAAWCAATIMKNHKRFGSDKVTDEYIEFLGNRYAPIGVCNDPQNLNSHWVSNVTAIYKGFKLLAKEGE